MTLANKITLVRITLIPVFVVGMILKFAVWPPIIFVISMITDVLDGLAARRLKQHTQLGSFLDPLADKLLLTAAFLTLTYLGRFPMWAFVVVFSRDLIILLGWIVIYILTGSAAIEPRYLGKTTTFTQMMCLLSVVINLPHNLSYILLWPMLTVTAASALDYIIAGAKKLGQFG